MNGRGADRAGRAGWGARAGADAPRVIDAAAMGVQGGGGVGTGVGTGIGTGVGPGGGPRRGEGPRGAGTPGVCVGCGYDLRGLAGVEGTLVCPECGAPAGRLGPVDVLPAEEAARLARSLRGVMLGMVFLWVPVVPSVVEAWGWWGASSVGRGGGWMRLGLRGANAAALLAALVAWAVVVDVYVLRRSVLGGVADDAMAGGAISAATLAWVVRQGVGLWWLARLLGASEGVPRGATLRVMAGLGVGVWVSGFVLLVLGVAVFHVAVMPPFCLLLPLWLAGAAGWFWAVLRGVWGVGERGAARAGTAGNAARAGETFGRGGP